jgi:hypothetical protein
MLLGPLFAFVALLFIVFMQIMREHEEANARRASTEWRRRDFVTDAIIPDADSYNGRAMLDILVMEDWDEMEGEGESTL